MPPCQRSAPPLLRPPPQPASRTAVHSLLAALDAMETPALEGTTSKRKRDDDDDTPVDSPNVQPSSTNPLASLKSRKGRARGKRGGVKAKKKQKLETDGTAPQAERLENATTIQAEPQRRAASLGPLGVGVGRGGIHGVDRRGAFDSGRGAALGSGRGRPLESGQGGPLQSTRGRGQESGRGRGRGRGDGRP